MKEEWKDIKGCDGDYQVSNLGRVMSLKRQNPIILKESDTKDGYKKVCLSMPRRGMTTMTVHKLVAGAFLNYSRAVGFAIDHIDNIKTNNRADNLQIISTRENNSKDRAGGTSGYVGVYEVVSGKWRAIIKINNKSIHLGYFEKEFDAGRAYDSALKVVIAMGGQ